jgi:hypothetical protein
VELLQEFVRHAPEHVIMDTSVYRPNPIRSAYYRFGRMIKRKFKSGLDAEFFGTLRGDEAMVLMRERPEGDADTIEQHGYVFHPSASCLEKLLQIHGMRVTKLNWHQQGISDWTSLEDYRERRRVSFTCGLR